MMAQRISSLAPKETGRRNAPVAASVRPPVAALEVDRPDAPTRVSAAERLIEVSDLHTEITANGQPFDVLRGISFHIDIGERLGIVGESGSGKSMTAMSILRLLPSAARISGGRIVFEGRDLCRASHGEMTALRGGRIAAVFQDPMTSLNPVLSIDRQMTDGMEQHLHLTRAQARKRALELLERVSIARAAEVLNSYPHQLSGGMRQRIAIATALACRPRLLIADEPTTALDVTVQAEVISLLQELTAQEGTAVMFISHSLDLVTQYCDRICVMYGGRIVESAGADRIVREPMHPYTGDLIASAPDVDAPQARRFRTIPGQPPQPGALPPGCKYWPRCSRAQAICRESEPPAFGDTHAACWLADPSMRRVDGER